MAQARHQDRRRQQQDFARADASSGAVMTSSNSSLANFASSQPRSDQDE
jgi:hypothetical protein